MKVKRGTMENKKGFQVKAPGKRAVRFRFSPKKSPLTCKAMEESFPFQARAVQARFAGEEIWIPRGPAKKIPREAASIHLRAGEMGYAPVLKRNTVARSIAIVYGTATLSGWVNVFATVFPEDRTLLKKLGERIWLKGACTLKFELLK